MPLPKPKKGESQNDFMGRCMADPHTKDMQGTNEQKVAACMSQFSEGRVKPKVDEIRKTLPEVERRYIPSDESGIELRTTEGQSPKIGMSIPFKKRSDDLGGFVETIAPGAFARTIKNGAAAKKNDIVSLWNHDPNWVLGRQSNRTLVLGEVASAMQGEVALDGEDAMHRHFARRVERRDVTGSSFGFMVTKEGQSWDMEGDTLVRTLTDVRLLDVSPVTFPAYPDSTSQRRSLVEIAAVKAGIDVTELAELLGGANAGKVGQDQRDLLAVWIAKLEAFLPSPPPPTVDWAARLALRERLVKT